MRPLHIIALIAVTAVWGANFAIAKLGLLSTPPLALSCLRFVLTAFPACLFFARPNIPAWRLIAIGLSLGALMSTFQFAGMHKGVTASVSSVLLQSQAILTVFLAVVFLKEKASLGTWGALALGTVGLGFFLLDSHDQATGIGMVMIIAAALCWAIGNILIRGTKGVNPVSLIVWMSFIPILPLAVMSITFERNATGAALFQVGAVGWASAAFLAFGVMIFGYGIWGYMLQRYDMKQVAPFSLLVPLFGVLFGMAAFSEALSTPQLVGTACLMISVVINLMQNRNGSTARRAKPRTSAI